MPSAKASVERFEIRVVEAQDKRAPGLAGQEVVQHGRTDIADVEPPGRAGREADDRFHGSLIVRSPPSCKPFP